MQTSEPSNDHILQLSVFNLLQTDVPMHGSVEELKGGTSVAYAAAAAAETGVLSIQGAYSGICVSAHGA